jgi:membrane fusion protein (multidrug efflux system)
MIWALLPIVFTSCHRHKEHAEHEHHKIVATSPMIRDVVLTQQYVCQIRSRRHINVCALQNGYIEEVAIKEGQAVKQGDVLFKIMPTLYQARLEAELAEAQLAQLEFNNTKKLFEDKVVSSQEVALQQAKLDKANAKAKLAAAELNFTIVRAPFDGIVDRLEQQLGSLVKEGEVLTTLSDNSVMWVYFNVPETRYLEYMAETGRGGPPVVSTNQQTGKIGGGAAHAPQKGNNPGNDAIHAVSAKSQESSDIELVLANGKKYPFKGVIGAIEAKFNNETGNIPFRADFPNPNGLLRHGQTGTVLIHRTVKNALVIPQRATFEVLDKQYVFVIDKDNVVRQRPIVVQNELDDIFVIKSGLEPKDRIVLDGVRQVHDGSHVKCEFRQPEVALANQKYHAE